jgi:hypothetical protein
VNVWAETVDPGANKVGKVAGQGHDARLTVDQQRRRRAGCGIQELAYRALLCGARCDARGHGLAVF